MKRIFVLATCSFVLSGVDAYAQSQCATLPYTLTNGSTADANQVMGNFTALNGNCAPLASPTFSGNVGIGVAPLATLDVGGVIRAQGANWPNNGVGLELAYDSGQAQGFIQSYNRGGAVWEPLQINASSFSFGGSVTASVKIGYIPSTTGNITLCSNQGVISLCAGSSIRFKENVKDSSLGLADVMRMRPVTFTWKANGDGDFGLIAEEMAEINPLYASYKDGQIYGVKYAQLTAVLVNAVKQLKGENDELKAELDRRTAMISHQETELSQLTSSNAALSAKIDDVVRRLDAMAPKAAMLTGPEHSSKYRQKS